MRVFVTGATGYIGRVVAEYLHQAGHQTCGLVRSDGAAERMSRIGVEPVRGDLSQTGVLAKAAAGAGAVVHCALQLTPDGGELDQKAVTAMLAALEGSGKPFVYTSGVWVIGDTRGKVVAELAPLRPPPIVAWRAGVEKLVLESAQRRVAACVLRPAMVFGRGGGFIGNMVQQAHQTKIVRIVGDGKNHWTYVHVEALAELYVRAVEQAPRGEVFLASDGPAYTVRIVADTVATMHEASVKLVPLAEARATMGPIADALVMDQKIMTTKAGRLLGWGPKRPTVLDEIRSGSYAT